MFMDRRFMNELEREVLLFVNERLYEKQAVTREMYIKAQDAILRRGA